MSVSHLPSPSPIERQHSQTLVEHIRTQITQAGGSLSFEQFMQLALYAPGLGYYSAGLRKFGAAGDFVTAPELSPLFSHCVAQQCAEIFAQLEHPSILEFGAGSGVMAADILAELERLACLPERYAIVEISAELQQRQRETVQAKVPHLLERVVWLTTLPENFRGLVLGNEVLDAMPVQRFRIAENSIEEQQVIWNGEALVSQFAPANAVLTQAVREISGTLPLGYESEWNPHLVGWFAGLAAALTQAVVLLFDYGFPRREFYHPQRDTGTLMCHYRHHAHADALLYPGLQDMTTHVDFTAVAEAADAAGLRVLGYTPQMYFLLHTGLQARLAASDAQDIVAHTRLMQQAQPLIMPHEMGELFKVIALSKDLDIVLCGFQQNFINRL